MDKLKKALLVGLLLGCILAQSWGQDVIVTYKSGKINAKVISVDNIQVKYKLFAQQDGAEYTIPKSDVVTILYENGVVDILVAQVPIGERNFNALAGVPIVKRGSDFCFEGTNISMSKWDYKDFLEINCPQAYQIYKKGRILNTFGIICTAIGGVMLLAGLPLTCESLNTWNTYKPITYGSQAELYHQYSTGVGLSIAGAVLAGGGVSMLSFGIKMKRHTSLDFYNNNCTVKKTAALNIGFQGNAVNLKLTF
ncbi:MAG: hypothetical protein LBR36_07720 [Bacteroidales bacterium]|jgi:hypothetical protein|nr:hypothetical protein [Bacteroidales bacterium]